jgi:hypothetical protein
MVLPTRLVDLAAGSVRAGLVARTWSRRVVERVAVRDGERPGDYEHAYRSFTRVASLEPE